MRILSAIILGALASAPLPAQAQSTDLGRSLSQLVDTAVTTNRHRKILAGLSAPLAYEPAAGPVDPDNAADPRNKDIAGVRLGMTVKQAQAALRAAGYVDQGPRDSQPSYANRVMSEWQSRYGFQGAGNDRAPQELLWRKGEEEIRVTLIALPDGPQVNMVWYWAKEGAPISIEEFTRRVLSKYGEPANDDPNQFRWCTVKAPDCEPPEEAEYPVLMAAPNSRQLTLVGNDPARKQALEERFAADVERRRPADQAPSF